MKKDKKKGNTTKPPVYEEQENFIFVLDSLGMLSSLKETEDVALVAEQGIPWDRLAFPVVIETLKLYFADRASGKFKTHCGEIIKQPDKKLIAMVYE